MQLLLRLSSPVQFRRKSEDGLMQAISRQSVSSHGFSVQIRLFVCRRTLFVSNRCRSVLFLPVLLCTSESMLFEMYFSTKAHIPHGVCLVPCSQEETGEVYSTIEYSAHSFEEVHVDGGTR